MRAEDAFISANPPAMRVRGLLCMAVSANRVQVCTRSVRLRAKNSRKPPAKRAAGQGMAKNDAAAKPAAMRVCRLFCKKSEKFAKIGLTFQIRSGKMCPRPASRAARKGSGGSNEPKPRQGRARQFSRTRTFRGAHEPLRSEVRRLSSVLPQETLPGGGAGEDKEREGKGRDACRGPSRDAS